MKKEIICTVCPTGCHITVEGEGSEITSLTGNTCARGKSYATDEFIEPKRILTSSVLISGTGRAMLPVRSSKPVPAALLFDCMKVIKSTRVSAPVKCGDVIIRNILGTGADMTATMDMSVYTPEVS